MLERRAWKEFQKAGLLWWVNRTLHLFGWAIVIDEDKETSQVKVYPAKCGYRGFKEEDEEQGFTKLTEHIKEQLPRMIEDMKKK